MAEAELAWLRAKYCACSLDRQSEFSETWANLGWHTLPFSADWAERAMTFLKTEHRE